MKIVNTINKLRGENEIVELTTFTVAPQELTDKTIKL
jgi:hypothetical protein